MFERLTERPSLSLFLALILQDYYDSPTVSFLILELILGLEFYSEPGWASLNLKSCKFLLLCNPQFHDFGKFEGLEPSNEENKPHAVTLLP